MNLRTSLLWGSTLILSLSLLTRPVAVNAAPLESVRSPLTQPATSALKAPVPARLVDQARLQELTGSLIADAQGRPSPAELEAKAAERATLYRRLMESDPEAALAQAIPESVRASLPASVQPYIETHVRLSGEVKTAVAFGGQLTQEEYYYILSQDEMPTKALSFASLSEHGPELSGQISLQGVELGGQVAVADYQLTGPAKEYPVGAGARKTITFPLTFMNNSTLSFTPAQLRGAVFTNADSANAYMKTLSGNKVSLGGLANASGDSFQTIYLSAYDYWCSGADIAGWANTALNYYYNYTYTNPTQYQHWIFAFKNANCSWAGLALLDDKAVWYNDYYTPMATQPRAAAGVISHELGHNFGLGHASGIYCWDDAGNWQPIDKNCRWIEYGDPYDTMGRAENQGRFSNFAMSRLGWLDPKRVLTVTKSGLYTLAPSENPGSGFHTLKIARSTPLNLYYQDMYGATALWKESADYFLEFRQPATPELFGPGAPVYNGVSIRLGGREKWANTFLVDTIAETDSWVDGPLTSGSFVDCQAGLRVTLVSVGPEGAKVQVDPKLSTFTTGTLTLPQATVTPTIRLRLDASNPCANLVSYRINNGQTWSDWASWTGAIETDLSLPTADGTKTVKVEIKDSTNKVATFAAPVLVDTKGPAGTIKINGGATYTASDATLTLSATDPAGVSAVRLSSDNQNWGEWQPYNTSLPWSFTGTTGATVQVWAQFQDQLGNIAAITASATALLDLTPPTGALKINGGANLSTNNPKLSLTMTATDAPAGVGKMRFSSDSGGTWTPWEPFKGTRTLEISRVSGQRQVLVQFQDKAGNLSDPIAQVINLDTDSPTIDGAEANGLYVGVAFNEALLPGLKPSAGNFSVKVNGKVRSATVQMDPLATDAVQLKLASPLLPGDDVTVTLRAGAVKDAAGNGNAAVTTPISVPNHSETPVRSAVTVDGSTLTLSYEAPLDKSSLPAPGDLKLLVNGKQVPLKTPVTVTENRITFTLTRPANQGAEVELTYNPSTVKLRDLAGNPVATFYEPNVTNLSNTGDGIRPELISLESDGPILILTYDEPLNESAKPATSAFKVTINGASPVRPSSVTVAGSAVYLKLPKALTGAEIVLVSYQPGSTGIQDKSQNDARGLTDQTATWAPTAPTLENVAVSGKVLTFFLTEALQTSGPKTTNFTVSLNGTAVKVSSIKIVGNQVQLTLASVVSTGATVTYQYTGGATPIKDLSGNLTTEFAGTYVVP